MTIEQIIDNAGGARQIAENSNGAIKADAVYKWPKIGIPDRHWPLILGLVEGLTPQELFEANVAARGAVTAGAAA